MVSSNPCTAINCRCWDLEQGPEPLPAQLFNVKCSFISLSSSGEGRLPKAVNINEDRPPSFHGESTVCFH